jgi:Fe-S cluster assembly protein SufD
MSVAEKYTVTDTILKLAESISSPIWEGEKRNLALSAFKKLGIPNRKSEEYKYCKIDLILKEDYALTSSKTITKQQLESTIIIKEVLTAVVVNGVYNKDLSNTDALPKGVTICSIQDAVKNHKETINKHFLKHADIQSDAFIALNASTSQDGVFIYIDKNTIVEKPIQVISISTSNNNLLLNTHNLFVVEKSAQVKIIEHYTSIDSTAKVFNNSLTEIAIAENVVAEHYKIQDEKTQGNLINTTQVQQNKQSVFTTSTITLSGDFVRNNLNIVLNGEHIESNLYGLYLTKNHQVIDNHTLVDHQQPNCNSNELYKGIISDESTATFNGKIFVRKDAQKTNAFQSNKNILLSDDGTVNTKPQLEIYADDVKCSHGTSTGKLDEDKIFYLRARGLSEDSAKKLLMAAFASDVLNTINIDFLKRYLEERVMHILE